LNKSPHFLDSGSHPLSLAGNEVKDSNEF